MTAVLFQCQECGAKTRRHRCPRCGSEDLDLASGRLAAMFYLNPKALSPDVQAEIRRHISSTRRIK